MEVNKIAGFLIPLALFFSGTSLSKCSNDSELIFWKETISISLSKDKKRVMGGEAGNIIQAAFRVLSVANW